MKLDPADLVLFSTVVAEGGFAKAAARLDMPNSTVSRRIVSLEKQLGERLLIRTTRKMVVTEYGLAILRHAQKISSELAATLAFTEQRHRVPTGLLRVSLPGDFTPDEFSSIFATFMQDYPQITLDINLSERRVDIIGEGYDLALRIGKLPDDATLAARHLGNFHVDLYASPGYLAQQSPLQHPDQLAAHAILGLKTNSTSPIITLLRGNERWQQALNMKMLANSPAILRNLALRDGGITCLARNSVSIHLAQRQLVRVLPEWQCPDLPIWAVFPAGKLLPSRSRVFIDSVVSNFKYLS